jgi:predicted AAA+ superfamily ATPase
MIDGYVAFHGLKIDADELRKRALAWAMGRGGRSGRVAWQFIQDLAGELGQTLD